MEWCVAVVGYPQRTLIHNRALADDRVLEFQFTVIFESLQAGGLPATIRAFSGLTMAGNTHADIRAAAKEAIGERAAAKEAIGERLQILLELGQNYPPISIQYASKALLLIF